MTPQIARDPRAGDPADLRGDLLDRDHQRKAEDEGPRQTITKLGADLAVGADPAGIVVGRARDQARPERLEERADTAGGVFTGFSHG